MSLADRIAAALVQHGPMAECISLRQCGSGRTKSAQRSKATPPASSTTGGRHRRAGGTCAGPWIPCRSLKTGLRLTRWHGRLTSRGPKRPSSRSSDRGADLPRTPCSFWSPHGRQCLRNRNLGFAAW